MIRKTCRMWNCMSPTVFSSFLCKWPHLTTQSCSSSSSFKNCTRYCSDRPIFKVEKDFAWDELLKQSNTSDHEKSSVVQQNEEEEAEYVVDLDSSSPKTLAQATSGNRFRIKRLCEKLEQFDEQMRHKSFIVKLKEKWNIKMELKKLRSLQTITYTKELLTCLDRSAARLYFDCANRFPYLKLCTALCLPDYLSTWYKLTLMHNWMLLVRLQSVLEVGAYIRFRNSLLGAMFDDIEKRLRIVSKELDEMLYHESDKRRMAGLYLQTFFEYDEGFLSSDMTLAGALWRNLYMQRSVDPIHLNRAVHYVRGTMAYLDSVSLEDILLQGIREWKIARFDDKINDDDAFKLAKNVAPTLLKQKYKHATSI